MTAQWQKTFVVLLTVLAQNGGEVTITKGTSDQVVADLARLTWAIEPGKEANEYVVRVVTGTDVATVPVTPAEPTEPVVVEFKSEAELDASLVDVSLSNGGV
jgi:hypothetical protein